MSLDENIARARALFEEFHKRAPRSAEITLIARPKSDEVVLEVGELLGIPYRAQRAGKVEKFYHEFEGERPRVFVTADGAQIFIVGGRYRFTDAGFRG